MGLFDFLNPVIDWFYRFLSTYKLNEPPYATFTLIVVSIIVTLMSYGATVLTMDMDEFNKTMRKVNDFNQKRKRAMQTANKKLWIEVQRKQKEIQALQMDMMMKRFVPTFITIIPFIIMFQILRATMGGPQGELAVWPFKFPSWIPIIGSWFHEYKRIPSKSTIHFGVWYIFTAIVTSVLMQRFIGITIPGMNQQGSETTSTSSS